MKKVPTTLPHAVALLLPVLAITVGCETTAPTIDTSASADVTFDGLYEVKGGSADVAWARADLDLSGYSKIMLQGVGIEYRPGGESGRTTISRNRGGPYEVTEKQKARFKKTLSEAFVKELRKSEHFTIVEEPGPDVLLVRGAILDVVSYVPPEATSARSEVFITRVGEATLVLELRDSITEAILARAIDRRAAEPGADYMRSNRVTNTAEVRRLASHWAKRLRDRLDEYGAAP